MKAGVAKTIAGMIFVLATGAQALAARLPAYRDDRSTPQAVVTSLYNAIGRHEYLRAWSYFRDDPGRPNYRTFARGYRDTGSVRLKLGHAASDGAAGSIFYALPVAIEAQTTDGKRTVFEGCYELRLIEPSIQDAPPFEPMGIVKERLRKTPRPFLQAMGSCAGIF